MRRLFFVAGFLMLSKIVIAQPYSPVTCSFQILLCMADPEWVDLDNDGLLDIFLLMKSKSDKSYVGIIKGDSIDPLSKMDKVFPIISSQAYLITDYDRRQCDGHYGFRQKR